MFVRFSASSISRTFKQGDKMMALTFLSLSFLTFFAFLLSLFSSNFIPLDFSTFHFKQPTKTVRDVFFSKTASKQAAQRSNHEWHEKGGFCFKLLQMCCEKKSKGERRWKKKRLLQRVRITVEKMKKTETSSEMKVFLDLGTKSRVKRR